MQMTKWMMMTLTCMMSNMHALLRGEIVTRQKDRDTHEWKYLVRGQTRDQERHMIVVVKLTPTGKLVWLTVYEE